MAPRKRQKGTSILNVCIWTHTQEVKERELLENNLRLTLMPLSTSDLRSILDEEHSKHRQFGETGTCVTSSPLSAKPPFLSLLCLFLPRHTPQHTMTLTSILLRANAENAALIFLHRLGFGMDVLYNFVRSCCLNVLTGLTYLGFLCVVMMSVVPSCLQNGPPWGAYHKMLLHTCHYSIVGRTVSCSWAWDVKI